MVTQSGQNARADGHLMCDRCTAHVYIPAGRAIPKCPNCGNITFSEVELEPPSAAVPEPQ